MGTEIDFLIELIFEHKLNRVTKDRIRERLKQVQAERASAPIMQYPLYSPPPYIGPSAIALPNPTGVPQAASTLRALARHEAQGQVMPPQVPVAPTEHATPTQAFLNPPSEPEAPKVIAHTPAAMAALAARAEAIKGKVDPATGMKRKF